MTWQTPSHKPAGTVVAGEESAKHRWRDLSSLSEFQLIANGARMKSKMICCLLLVLFIVSTTAKAQGAGKGREVAERAKRYDAYLADSAARHGVDARLLWVIAWLETRFNPAAVSRKGARGLMQMMPATARRFGLKNPHEPAAAIDAAAKYVRLLMERYDGRADLVLAAYNAGEGAVDAYLTGRAIQAGNKLINPGRRVTGGIPPYHETRSYVTNGLRLLNSSSSSLVARQRSYEKESSAGEDAEEEPKRPAVRHSVTYAAMPESGEGVSSAKVRRSISW
jgi:hypothetical protein